MPKKIGLIVNPIAGMGGRVGLKGTDGAQVLDLARERGAQAEAPGKARKALRQLEGVKDLFTLLLAEGSMGTEVTEGLDLNQEIVYTQEGPSQRDDTLQLAQILKDQAVDLILFAGGDGTARDLVEVIGLDIPVIGIPAGVKIHSPVYARTPEHAGQLAGKYIQGDAIQVQDEEVIDIEEAAFRQDEIITQVYGYLSVPYDQSHMQNLKSPTPQSDAASQESIALYILDHMEEDVTYILGTGSTVAAISEELGQPTTRLGVDVMRNREIIAKDVGEEALLDILDQDPKTQLILTPMGGQGYLIGRGNHQISDRVLAHIPKSQVIIVATPHKLTSLHGQPLLVYSGDPAIDQALSGYYKVVTGYEMAKMYKVQPA